MGKASLWEETRNKRESLRTSQIQWKEIHSRMTALSDHRQREAVTGK